MEQTRYSVTTTSINQLEKVLKVAVFESQKRHGKPLFAVIGLTNDQVEARHKGFGYNLQKGGEHPDR